MGNSISSDSTFSTRPRHFSSFFTASQIEKSKENGILSWFKQEIALHTFVIMIRHIQM